MKLLDLWDALCGDGGQPWPADSLFDVEVLNYHEALKILKMHQRGEVLPSAQELRECIAEREAAGFDLGKTKGKDKASKAIPLLVKGARRRAMTQALGATDRAEQADLAREAGTALDRVATAAKKVGVRLDLFRRGSRRELLNVAATLMAGDMASGDYRGDVHDIDTIIGYAQKLIAAVDRVTKPKPSLVTESATYFGHDPTESSD